MTELKTGDEKGTFRRMLTSCRVGVLYPARRAASTADPDNASVAAWGAGREKSGQ